MTLRKSVKYIVIIIFLFTCFYFKDEIVKFITSPAKKNTTQEIRVPKVGNYKVFDGKFKYVASTDNFVPSSKQDIMDIIYTILNSGWKEFTFYCPTEYTECVNDVTSITNNDETLSNINNFVHPYNSFKTIETNYTTSGEITIIVHKMYSDNDIKELNKKVDEIYNKSVKDNMTTEEKIKAIHDYIINNAKYDDAKISGVTKENSNTAVGVLIDGYGICSGYTDAMAIFLNKLEIPNIKVSSAKHIWNLVYLDGRWLNLDLTFDDPIVDTGEDLLIHDYFLKDTKTIIKNDKSNQHNFDKKVFVEAVD